MNKEINTQSMLHVGTILRGVYRIDSYLSSGGFGNTYVATNIEFDERFAIKEFFMKGVTQRAENQITVSVSNSDNHSSFYEQKDKFKKEARRIRQIKNEHIVRVHDLFEENGTAYYVMDYIDGENLSEYLKRTGEPMPELYVWKILTQLLNALESVHKAGIWHLDLKPANVMVDNYGVVRLIDFGASKQFNVQKGGATTSTAISYTNGYAPREQMEQNYDKFGPWTDIYALGATLYTLVTNKRPPLPTDIDDDMTSDKHLALPFINGISDNLKSIILWMLQTNRRLRPQNISEILSKIGTFSSAATNKDVHIDGEDTIVAVSQDEETIIESPSNVDSNEDEKHESVNDNSQKKGISSRNWFIIIIICIVFLGAISALIFNTPKSKMQVPAQDTDSIAEVIDSVADELGLHYKTEIGDCEYYGNLDNNYQPDDLNGEAYFNDGRYYKGPFSHGELTGDNAYFKYPNGDVFKGEFRQNSFYKGVYVIAEDGSYFVGTFKKGQPDIGLWYDKKGNVIQ